MVRSGEISQSELMQAYSAGSGKVIGEMQSAPKSRGPQITVSQVLSSIGGLIVCVGIIILVFQHWDDLSSMLRIFVTLGVSVAAYITAVLFQRYPNFKITTLVVFGVSMVLLPLGLMVTMHELANGNDALAAQIIVSLISFVVAIASFLLYRTNLFVAFSVAFGTWFYYVIIIKMLESTTISFHDFNIYAYMTIAAGLAYMLIGYAFDKSETRRELSSSMYKLGLFAVLASALTLDGAWDVIYVFVVFGAILLSVYLKNKTFLWLGAVFLMFYIIKMTAVHFYKFLNWPLALVLAGIALIAIGYVTHYIGRKYITKNEPVRP